MASSVFLELRVFLLRVLLGFQGLQSLAVDDLRKVL